MVLREIQQGVIRRSVAGQRRKNGLFSSMADILKIPAGWLLLFTAFLYPHTAVAVEQCPAIYHGAVQTHGPSGRLYISPWAQIINAPSGVITTPRIYGNGQRKACSDAACIANGQDTSRIDLPPFPAINSTRNLNVGYWQRATVGEGPDSEYRHIHMGYAGTLVFSNARKNYRIGTLSTGYGTTLELTPGDYWVDRIYLGGNNDIRVKGTGKVRLFVNSDLYIPFNTRINENTKDSSRMSIVVNGRVHQYASSKVSALLYVQGKYEIDSFARLKGMVNAAQIQMGYRAKIDYQERALSDYPLGMVCAPVGFDDLDGDGIVDEKDDDRDGDGISNQYEVAVGTDPDDPGSLPQDHNGNGIPDELETVSFNNQCVAAFSNGIQAHGSDHRSGKVWFEYNAQLLNSPDRYLPANDVITRLGSWKKSCGNEHCSYTGQAGEPLPDLTFKASESNDDHRIRYRQEKVFSNGHYGTIAASSRTRLTFNTSGDQEYRIKRLSAGWGSELTLAAGDYWIEHLRIDSSVKINIAGEGTVRLYVKDSVRFPWDSRINWTGDKEHSASNLVLYSWGEIALESSARLSGFIYSRERVFIAYGARVKGAINGSDVILRTDATVNYAGSLLDKTDFGLICDIDNDGIYDGFDPDRDGDGISNKYEEQLGFDPDDSNSTPADLDKDGIPDVLDDDRDGDGHNNSNDAFPDNPEEWFDLDGDGTGDNTDTDRDGDGISNDHEEQLGFDPNDKNSTPADQDGDSIPDALDEDRDGDGHNNDSDRFPDDKTEWSDLDDDGVGDNADTDRDGDGISNDHEEQLGFDPNDAGSTPPDLDGDRVPDALDDDMDGDGVPNAADRFPRDVTEWSDIDNDGLGDNSDPDRDGDGISNDHETQLGFDPDDKNSTPSDLDKDSIPDALDDDRDGDDHSNDADAFPDDASEWADLDGDGIGDNSDPDRDGDTISNEYEIELGFDPNDSSSTPPDLDKDTIPDVLDNDRDGDGYNNDSDTFPDDKTEWSDLDKDGIGDNSDPDRDGDTISNEHEEQLGFDPDDNSSTPPDLDKDTIPDALDDDRDGDGHNNDMDIFPDNADEWADLDGDGIGDNSDDDRDGDSISNDHEIQLGFDPDDSSSTPPDQDKDGTPDALDDDRDGDGHNNDADRFPDDASEWVDLDSDGIGDNSDPDRDGDGISNDHEQQLGFDPNDSGSTPPDQDGDAIPDALDDDRDGDGHNNDLDAFPDDTAEWSDMDGDGIGDNSDPDRDGDTISNEYEIELGFDPNDSSSTPPDLDKDTIPDALDDDRDGDSHNNDTDAFPDDPTEWADLDGDGIGDNSDPDRDGDGISNTHEQQLGYDPDDASVTPPDLDGDHLPDALDDDRDGDGYNNDNDVFPDDASEWSDLDGDGIGDNSDSDRDGDTISNDHEVELGFDPNDSSSTPPDLDKDTIPDALDNDRDGDGYNNDSDTFPDDKTEWSDLDKDGIGDNSDLDRDGDSISNDHEIELGFDPNDSSSTPADLDKDTIPDALDDDRDGDGYTNEDDAFPDNTTEWSDLDKDGIGDNSDPDRDGDGISNAHEEQLGFDPNDSKNTPPDLDNDGLPDALDADRDGDGINNGVDLFPDDANEWADLDGDGIGDNNDTDRDGDGFSNEEEVKEGTDPEDASDYPDQVPPVITLNGPDTISTEEDLANLGGTVTDEGYGVEKLWIMTDRYPGTEFAVLINEAQWTAAVPLEEGSNGITLHARDKAGNTSQKNISVERENPDNPIGLTISYPQQNSRMSDNGVVVRGQARSDRPANTMTVTVAGENAVLSNTSQVRIFEFESPRIMLDEGVNSLPVVLTVDGESIQRNVIIIHEPVQPELAPPRIRILSPVSGTQLSEDSFVLIAEIEAEGGIDQVALNNQTILSPGETLHSRLIREPVSFNGSEELTLTLTATDKQGRSESETMTYAQDVVAPILRLDQVLIPLPGVNRLAEQPFPVTGTVIDRNLSSFSINGNPVSLTPVGDGSGYRFSAAVGVSAASPSPLRLEARDQAGQLTVQEYSLQLSTALTLTRILPADGLRLLGGESQSLQVGVQLDGFSQGVTVSARLLADDVEKSHVVLSGDGAIRSGNLTVPRETGLYELLIEARDQSNAVVSRTRSSLEVEAPEQVTVAVEKMEPADNSHNAEPNGFIAIHFNTTVDPEKISVQIHETAHGYTYIDQDAPGVNGLEAKGYELVSVNRSFEPVPGELSVLPGNRVMAFYPQRELAYDSEVFVDIKHEGETLARSRFTTRKLPTFIQGSVVDQLGQGVADITVTLPELNRSVNTNEEGAFTFGYGDQPGQEIPAGRYQLVINPGLQKAGFGSSTQWLSIEGGRRNRADTLQVPILSRDTTFSPVAGGRELSLLEGAIKMDMSDARLLFPDGRLKGDVHAQFAAFSQIPHKINPLALPLWLYTLQPAGVHVEGDWSLDLQIPALNGQFDHVPEQGTYVLLLGLDNETQQITPVGVGQINGHRVSSRGPLEQTTLDVLGYAYVEPQVQPLLQQYADEEITLPLLLAEIQTRRRQQAAEQ